MGVKLNGLKGSKIGFLERRANRELNDGKIWNTEVDENGEQVNKTFEVTVECKNRRGALSSTDLVNIFRGFQLQQNALLFLQLALPRACFHNIAIRI